MVYILASERNGALFVEVTSNHVQRIWQQKNEAVESAIARDKAIKGWKRA